MRQNPSLRDLAAMAGCSVGTVSLALRNDRRVAAHTRDRILKLAETQGYRPSPLLAQLARQRFRRPEARQDLKLALLTSENTRWRQSSLFQTLREEAARQGYQLQTYFHEDLLRLGEGLGKYLNRQGVEGALLWRTRAQDLPQALIRGKTPILALHPYEREPQVESIRIDYIEDLRLHFEQAAAAGCERIGAAICSHELHTYDDTLRISGVLAGQATNPQLEAIPPYTGSFNDWKALRDWAKKHRIDALIGFTWSADCLQSTPSIRWISTFGPCPAFYSAECYRGYSEIDELTFCQIALRKLYRAAHFVTSEAKLSASPVTLVPTQWIQNLKETGR